MSNKLEALKLLASSGSNVFFAVVEGLADDGKLNDHEILDCAAAFASSAHRLAAANGWTRQERVVGKADLLKAFLDAGWEIRE